ncbi:MAG: dephospho-CoA kinase [Deltaproteobacteria bacterium RBG_13_61_14]|nr:MAG: dephospho-CoA kinase [Deltaproteobacteria bacterium RBG_13_61_14]
MRVVGLTGGIASGKSTVARMFVELGARLVDADLLARQVVEPDKPAWGEIADHFGEGVLNPDRTLNREKLAEIIFRDPDERRVLNDITHPRIGAEMLDLIQRFQREGAAVVLIDAALLLESPATNWIRPVVVVTAEEEVRAERIMERDGLSQEQALARIRSQMREDERKTRADYVIDNSGSLEDLQDRVEEVWIELLSSEAD